MVSILTLLLIPLLLYNETKCYNRSYFYVHLCIIISRTINCQTQKLFAALDQLNLMKPDEPRFSTGHTWTHHTILAMYNTSFARLKSVSDLNHYSRAQVWFTWSGFTSTTLSWTITLRTLCEYSEQIEMTTSLWGYVISMYVRPTRCLRIKAGVRFIIA